LHGRTKRDLPYSNSNPRMWAYVIVCLNFRVPISYHNCVLAESLACNTA
jgi:hypothetical protein